MILRTRRWLTATLLTASGIARGSTAEPPKPVPTLALKAQRLLDVRRGTHVESPVVLVAGDKVVAVGPGLEIPKGTTVLDLGRVTLLPGLVDSHTHLLMALNPQLSEDDNMVLQAGQQSTAKRALMGAALAREVLMAGITTVRDMGNNGEAGDVALRDAIHAGWLPGARIYTSTRALAAAGGQFGALNPAAQHLVDQEYVIIAGEDEARKATRQAIYLGADWIKVIVDTGPRVLSPPELKVIVEEAHRVGRRVAAHAVSNTAARMAVEAGVDSLEHGYELSDATLKLMVEKKVALVPTDYTARYWNMYLDAIPGLPDDEKAHIRKTMFGFVSSNKDRLVRANKAGVRVVFGSDAYYRVPGKTRGEVSLAVLDAYRDSGMSALDIIRSATLNGAELLGRDKMMGSVEPGRWADIIAVGGDPLQDISLLQRVGFVMKAGTVVRHDLPAAKP